MRCFSRMLIYNVHKSILVINTIDTRFSRNVFEAVQKTRSTCCIGSTTTRLRLSVLNPIKHSCSFFKHYIKLVFLRTFLITIKRLRNSSTTLSLFWLVAVERHRDIGKLPDQAGLKNQTPLQGRDFHLPR